MQRQGPFRLIEQPRYRAAWDFLRLRAQSGEIPMSLPDWWDCFAHAGHDTRETLLTEAPGGAESAERKRRRRRRKPAEAVEPSAAVDAS